MNKLFFLLTLFSFSMYTHSANADQTATTANSPTGYWQTIDDVTGQPKAIVKIDQLPNQSLSAHILKIYPQPGQDQNPRCTECKDERHNQRIIGLQIMEDLKQDKKNRQAWTNGKILDPKNGKIYHCNIQLMENNKLQVRGYIGLPLFGRSQTWIRTTL